MYLEYYSIKNTEMLKYYKILSRIYNWIDYIWKTKGYFNSLSYKITIKWYVYLLLLARKMVVLETLMRWIDLRWSRRAVTVSWNWQSTRRGFTINKSSLLNFGSSAWKLKCTYILASVFFEKEDQYIFKARNLCCM